MQSKRKINVITCIIQVSLKTSCSPGTRKDIVIDRRDGFELVLSLSALWFCSLAMKPTFQPLGFGVIVQVN